MNNNIEKYIKSISELESSGRFYLIVESYGRTDKENPLYYDQEKCRVSLTIYRGMSEDEIAESIAKAYTLVDKAQREWTHAKSHPDTVKALLAHYS